MYAQRLNWIVVFLLLVGCTSLPVDTLNKRIAVFEVGYSQTLKTIQHWLKENRIKPQDRSTLKTRIAEMSLARTAMHEARKIGNAAEASTQLMLGTSTLGVLRKYIAQQETSP